MTHTPRAAAAPAAAADPGARGTKEVAVPSIDGGAAEGKSRALWQEQLLNSSPPHKGKKKCSSPSARAIKRHPMQKNGLLLKPPHQACLQASAKQIASLPILGKKRRYLMETRHPTLKRMIGLYSWGYILKRSYLFQGIFKAWILILLKGIVTCVSNVGCFSPNHQSFWLQLQLILIVPCF